MLYKGGGVTVIVAGRPHREYPGLPSDGWSLGLPRGPVRTHTHTQTPIQTQKTHKTTKSLIRKGGKND